MDDRTDVAPVFPPVRWASRALHRLAGVLHPGGANGAAACQPGHPGVLDFLVQHPPRPTEPLHGRAFLRDNREYTRWKVDQILGQSIRGERVLDLGCSVGLMPDHWLRANKVLGLDHNEAVLTAAAHKGYSTIRFDLNLSVYLPLASRAFDTVLAFDVLEHTAHPLALLRELHRVVRPGGRLVLSVPNSLNLVNRALTLLGRPEDITDRHHWLGLPFSDHLQRIALRPLLDVLAHEGFCVRTVKHFAPGRVRHRNLRLLQGGTLLCRRLALEQRFPGLLAVAHLLVCTREQLDAGAS